MASVYVDARFVDSCRRFGTYPANLLVPCLNPERNQPQKSLVGNSLLLSSQKDKGTKVYVRDIFLTNGSELPKDRELNSHSDVISWLGNMITAPKSVTAGGHFAGRRDPQCRMVFVYLYLSPSWLEDGNDHFIGF